MFKNIRKKYFHKPYVEEEKILLILNGSNWKMLHGYQDMLKRSGLIGK